MMPQRPSFGPPSPMPTPPTPNESAPNAESPFTTEREPVIESPFTRTPEPELEEPVTAPTLANFMHEDLHVEPSTIEDNTDELHLSDDLELDAPAEKEDERTTVNDNPLASFWTDTTQTQPLINPEQPYEAIDPDVAPRAEPSTATIEYFEASENGVAIDDFLDYMLENGGSDLHLSAGSYPMVRKHGEMIPIPNQTKLSGDDIARLITDIMTINQRNVFEEEWELDFAYTLPGKSRFRVNVMRQQGNVSVVMRTIPWEIKSVEQLGLPTVMREWASIPRGLILVTGPTGSGKSTSLAAIIDHANRTRKGHIVTIEDPIEFVHEHRMSVINQREVGTDTKSFAAALKHVLRQDPDIILVGELRDLETISVALSAAETGHAVFGTLHTQSAAETVSRLVDVFPEGAQQQVRTQIAATIQGIACQTLLKTYDGKGRVAATEIMVGTSAIRNLIREGKLEQIPSALQTGEKYGMQTLDSVLERYVREGKVHFEDALDKAHNRKELEQALGGRENIEKLDRQIRNNTGGIVF